MNAGNMNTAATYSRAAALILALGALASCAPSPGTDAAHDGGGGGTPAAAALTNRVPIDAARREALGLTFATVAERPIGRAWMLPGTFELAPDAARSYHAMVSGRVELLVDEFDRVEVGDPLYTLDSPDWRGLQHELSEALGGIARADGELAGAEAAREENRTKVESLSARLEALRELDVRRADLEAELATAQVSKVRFETQVRTARNAHLLALEHYEGTLNRASSVVGIDAAELDALETNDDGTAIHHWWTIDRVVVRARDAGVVEHRHVTPGAWLASGDAVLDTLRPQRLRFRARVTANDLPHDLDGLACRVTLDATGSGAWASVTRIARAPRADAVTRRERVVALELEPEPWMRAGASGWLELVDDSAGTVLCVPRACVQRDGLTEVLFRRNPKDADQAIRLEADLGAQDDTWVEVRSGVRAGDQIVLAGAWELALESSLAGVDTSGGHFHADGTFHAEDH